VGLLITLISCACYVATWEVVYFKLKPDFWMEYTAFAVEQKRSSGASDQEVERTRRELTAFKTEYDKPLVNAAYTFLEPFPVGLPNRGDPGGRPAGPVAGRPAGVTVRGGGHRGQILILDPITMRRTLRRRPPHRALPCRPHPERPATRRLTRCPSRARAGR